MYKRHAFIILAICILATSIISCAGVQATPKMVGDTEIIFASQKDAVGPNGQGIIVNSKKPLRPAEVVDLEYNCTESVIKWDGCADETPNKRARNIHQEKKTTKGSYQVLVPGDQPAQPVVVYGTGPGPVESVPPALLNAAGNVGAAAVMPETKIGVSQVGGGAKVIGSGNSKNVNVNKNDNTNVNKLKAQAEADARAKSEANAINKTHVNVDP